jgi:lichenan operon transcriptional antiterminator
VSRTRQNRLLTRLAGTENWLTAASLADFLGVTPRTVRSYVAALNSRVADGIVVESGVQGYRAGPAARAALREDAVEPGTPRARLHELVRRLLEADAPLDVHDVADEIYVSSATVEGDLARVRSFLKGSGVVLQRQGSQVWLQGTEMAQRRLLSRLVHDQTEMKSLDFPALMRVLGEGSVGAEAYARFRSDLVDALGDLGYFVNEYAIADVLMHVAIAADRISRGRPLATGTEHPREDAVAVGDVLDALALRHFGIRFDAGDREFLTTVVLSRLAAPRLDSVRAAARERVDPAVKQAVLDACAAASAEFLVDLSGEDFTWRLILHVQNLVERPAGSASSRNPLRRGGWPGCAPNWRSTSVRDRSSGTSTRTRARRRSSAGSARFWWPRASSTTATLSGASSGSGCRPRRGENRVQCARAQSRAMVVMSSRNSATVAAETVARVAARAAR